jgi:transcriptional regulator with XRE-family HTH domain
VGLDIIGDVGDQQVGALLRAVRIRGRKRQEDVAAGARVHRSKVSSIERGLLDDVLIGELRAIAAQLEIRVEVGASWRGGDGARVVNERHSRMHELVAARLAATPGWQFATEVTFSEYGERGVIDILAWHAATRTLLVIELKTEIPDPAGLVAQVDRYARLARQIGRGRGWDASRVAAWALVAESDLNRRQLARHRTLLRNTFPLDGHFLRRWLRAPSFHSTTPGQAEARVCGLSFLVNDAGESTNGRLGPTKRVGRPRQTPDRPESRVNDALAGHRRGNHGAVGRASPRGDPGDGDELGQ